MRPSSTGPAGPGTSRSTAGPRHAKGRSVPRPVPRPATGKAAGPTGSQSPRSGRCERRRIRKPGPVRPQAIRSPERQQPSTPALVLHPRSLGRDLGLRGADEVAQHLPADRWIAPQQPLHNRIVLGHRRRSWLVRALTLRRLHSLNPNRRKRTPSAAFRAVVPMVRHGSALDSRSAILTSPTVPIGGRRLWSAVREGSGRPPSGPRKGIEAPWRRGDRHRLTGGR